jgi:CRP-like cAMP-binding protein
VPEPFDLDTIDLPGNSEIHALLEACPDIESLRFANDEFLVHGSEPGQDIFLLLRGHCLVEQPDAPRERTPGNELAVINAEPGAPVFVGEMAYLGEGLRSATVRSVMATFTLRLKPAHLDTIMDQFPGFTRILCRQFALRLREANIFIKRYQTNNAMAVEQRFLGPGEVLAEAGTPADKLFQLVDGVLLEKGDPDMPIRASDDGPVFVGTRPFFQGGVYEKRVVAKTQAIVVALGKSRQAAIIRNFPELALEMIQKSDTTS